MRNVRRYLAIAALLSGFGACNGRTSIGEMQSDTTGGSTSTGATNSSMPTGTTGGSGGSGSDSGVVIPVIPIRPTKTDKVDLLFVIDNSVSMADKQRMLKDAVPSLLRRLISPNCVSTKDPTIFQPGLATCPIGFEQEFSPLSDIHIGVISTSLGGHGADECSVKSPDFNPSKDDQAHLLATTPRGLVIPTYGGGGFLQWDPAGKKVPRGEADAYTLITNFQNMVVAAGETGCGYEAPLESWYRFLVEPFPYASIDQVNSATVQSGLDQAVLDQRKAFLRADSLLAIIMLTDENDCSIQDEGYGWLVGTTSISVGGAANNFNMLRGTTTCETQPNSPCCRSCAAGENSPPLGCDPVVADLNCQGPSKALAADQDPANLRCFNQKRRFGLDLLYPTSRYVQALQQPTLTVPDPSDPSRVKTKTVPNPIYSDLQGNAPFVRGPELVFLAGIVGVPWQDIADDASLPAAAGLKYLTSGEITERKIWDDILGTPLAAVNPKDPLMVESVAPRSGKNPRTGIPLAPPTSTNPKAAINGHEYQNADSDDLQYACIFDQPEGGKDCIAGGVTACDCGFPPSGGLSLADVQKQVLDNNSPLCNPPGGGAASTHQYAAKGYPGLRILQVLKDLGPNSIVASICPKVSKAATEADKASPSYGYNPALTAIIDRFKPIFPVSVSRAP